MAIYGMGEQFVNHIPDERFYSGYIKNSYNSTKKETVNPVIKWAKYMNRYCK